MTNYLPLKRKRLTLRPILTLTVPAVLILCLFVFTFIELKLRPMIADAAKSRARLFAAELINDAVTTSLADAPPLVSIGRSDDGVASIETDIAALSKLRSDIIGVLNSRMHDAGAMTFSVPLGTLTDSVLIAGHGIPIEIRLTPVGDISADVRTEFIESGINQTLHKIILRVRVTLNIFSAGEEIRLELASDVTLAETVVVGKVPDAYTSINRFEIDEEEENDLNDYAATLP